MTETGTTGPGRDPGAGVDPEAQLPGPGPQIEPGAAGRPADDEVRPDAVAQAAAWLRWHQGRYTREALDGSLRATGYTRSEIDHAWREIELSVPPPDLRSRAAWILVVAFLATWGVLSLLLMRGDEPFAPLAVGVLSVVLLPILGLSLVGVDHSEGLRRGLESALIAVLAVPFILLVIVAGLCVMTTGNLMTG